ncbi:unnamed protein product [Nesidiocoris tenuis]|uniref:Uncharacterized protein n=2 Tax=Nesidiocoris tenuis TaxID=355587 RepID=A0A6H5H789_9HEMI|nr:Neurochondrin [Nesidiocoris tenuis]CAB0012182.1 unnamed protein product [Nesidiocoris tenuis]
MEDPSVSDAVKKIASMLQRTRSDLEKVACLFGVVQLLKKEKSNAKAKELIFQSIGVDFLKRILLASDNFEGDECPVHVYKSVALSILEILCADPDLATNKEMLTIIPAILKIAQLGDDDDCDDDNLIIVSEAYEILRCLSAYDEGKVALLENGAIDTFIQIYSGQCFKSDEALQILVLIVHHFGPKAWDKADPKYFHSLMNKVTVDFETEPCDRKFELCGVLQLLLSSCHKDEIVRSAGDESWPQSIRKGLSEILTNRVTKNQRDPALKLSSVMMDTFGVDWALGDSDKPKQFLLLLVQLCSVEVRMQLEEKPLDTVLKNVDLVTACFTILELSVAFISTGVIDLDQKEKQQLYTALKGAFSAVLNTLKKILIRSMKEEGRKPVTDNETQFTFAMIRTLAAWLAQETNAMRSTVLEVLPFILCVANDSFYAYRTWWVKNNKSTKQDCSSDTDDNQKPTDILKALLPALCHFTIEEKGREIMLRAKEDDVLTECFSFHWSIVNYKPPPPPKAERLKNKRPSPELPLGMAEAMNESRAALVSMCNIFMNIIVLEPKMIEDSEAFHTLLKFILSNLTDLKRNEENIVLHANMAVLGLLLLKHQAKKVKKNDFSICRYIQCTIRFLWDAYNVDESNDNEVLVVSMEYKKYWMDLMELWFLGMQTISVVLTHIPWISEFIVETGWAQGMVETLKRIRVGTLPPNTRHAYEDFLLHLVKTNSDVIPVLKDLDVITVCRNHLFMELGKFLFGD